MKKVLFTIMLMLLPMLASADAVEIDGIYYNLNSETKTAVVTSNPEKYSGSVDIPENVKPEESETEYSVTAIFNRAFECCSGLTSVTIPGSVTSIGVYAFSECSGLTSITIPGSVTSIGEFAFYGCSGLTAITVDESNPNFKSEEGVLFSKDGTTLITYPIGKTETAYTIPNSVTNIGTRAFEDCNGLTSITIPGSVTYIGDRAFQGCSGLASATIPGSVTYIGKYAFSGCSGMTTITIPNSVTTIDGYAFRGCSGLTSVTIPGSVTTIEEYAFRECEGLKSITIVGNETSIGYCAFSYCSGLTDFYCYATEVPETKNSVFKSSNIEQVTLHVPEEAIEAYNAVEPWSNFKEIVELVDESKFDLNGDGVVNAADVVELVNFIMGE